MGRLSKKAPIVSECLAAALLPLSLASDRIHLAWPVTSEQGQEGAEAASTQCLTMVPKDSCPLAAAPQETGSLPENRCPTQQPPCPPDLPESAAQEVWLFWEAECTRTHPPRGERGE
eukprot:6306465-Pyramimonas_sp.AAC.1